METSESLVCLARFWARYWLPGGTATLNQWMERVWDGQMRRTATRPIPSGRVHAREALLLGISLSVVGGLYLLIEVNGLSALLAIATLLSYLLVYTP